MDKDHPLSGVRVLSLGGVWAGRVASMLLADQGADVIELSPPDREDELADAALGRGKIALSANLKDPADQARVLRLASQCDIVLDNLGPGRAARFGVGYEAISRDNPSVVYVSIPGFAEGSEWDGLAPFEGTIAASVGVYTDIHAHGPILGGAPIFSSVPMASTYGGVHAAIAASLAFLDRLRTGTGRRVEAPLADALLSAMALLIMKVDGQPQRFDLPPIDKVMTDIAFPLIRQFSEQISDTQRAAIKSYLDQVGRPQFGNYVCGDGRMVFITAVDHVRHVRACLETLGILDDLIAEGMVLGSPYEEDGRGNNVSNSPRLSPYWSGRLRTLMGQCFRTRPAQEWETLLQQAGVPVTVVRTTEEWLALPAAREGGNVVELDDPRFGAVAQPGRYISIEGPSVASGPLASREGGDATTEWRSKRASAGSPAVGAPGQKLLAGLRVLDLSNVIAGPVAARILAEFGASVTRIDAPAPMAGPRMTMWFGLDVNQGKRAVILDLKCAEGRAVFQRMVREADVVLHNILDGSTSKLGISDAELRKINPDIISCQVSAWGGPEGGPFKAFPAFDPVLQAATGITARYGAPDAPVLHGIASCVDYITGFSAALGVAQALVAKALGRGGAHVRTSLSMGAQLVQAPLAVSAGQAAAAAEPSSQHALGYGPHYRLYKAEDRWVFLASRPASLAAVANRLGVSQPTEASLAKAMATRTFAELSSLLNGLPSVALTPVMRLDQLREHCASVDQPDRKPNSTGLALREVDHPSGYRVTLPVPTWCRIDGEPAGPLAPAPAPGADTRLVLGELGLAEGDIDDLIARNVAREGWAVLKRYLPR